MSWMQTSPTLSMTIEGFLQCNNRESMAKKPLPHKSCEAAWKLPASDVARRSSVQQMLYCPSLYKTPELVPVRNVPSILPSPKIYVVNHKRRDWSSRAAVTSKVNGGESIILYGPYGVFAKGKEEEEEEEERKKVLEIVEEANDVVLDLLDSWNAGTSGSDVVDVDSLLGNPRLVKSPSQDEYYDTADGKIFRDQFFFHSFFHQAYTLFCF